MQMCPEFLQLLLLADWATLYFRLSGLLYAYSGKQWTDHAEEVISGDVLHRIMLNLLRKRAIWNYLYHKVVVV
jgi:hypothetical protein